ncbi:Thioredoxin-like protein [Corchorus capsularis]|uniref:Thioredoxin-like protein n=1 Tax=Corchorus capsularis TaxID=210143 RepID=A0A1R3IWU5_COCAP|nr:Thioredoxin-like protein [Corchorus capsularis]
MEHIFNLIEMHSTDSRIKVSITESTMMQIVHSAMDKAYRKVKSKNGVLERLNEISKFYELAVMQLEGCLKFVQEEADNYVLESGHEILLEDLTEIRDRLQGRLKEVELAISEKDRELAERLANEFKHRKALEKELDSLHADLKCGKRKNEGIGELFLGTQASTESGDREGEFCELKNSVDQQVLNIQQQLEPNYQHRDEERNQVIDNKKIEQMGSDISILKETMDLAFCKMQNAICLSELGPMEHQWMWNIERSTADIVIKGFMKDFQQNFEDQVKKREMQFSFGLRKNLSDVMRQMTCLSQELDHHTNQDEVQVNISKPKGGFPKANRRCLSEGDFGDSNNFLMDVEETNTKKQPCEKDSGDDGGNYVAKMIKNHESIIRRKSAEIMIPVKPEILREKGCPSFKKDYVNLKRRIQEVIVSLESLINCNPGIVHTFGECRYNYEVEKPSDHHVSSFTADKMDIKESGIESMEEVWAKVNKPSVSHVRKEEKCGEMRILRQEMEDRNLQTMMMEQIYLTLFKSLAEEFHTEMLKHKRNEEKCMRRLRQEMEDTNLQAMMMEQMYLTLFRSLAEEFQTEMFNHHLQCLIKEGMYENFIEEMRNELNESNLEGMLEEDVYTFLLQEIHREQNDNIESYESKSSLGEEICFIVFGETIRHIMNTANWECKKLVSNTIVESAAIMSIKDDVWKLFLAEMIKEWQMKIDCSITESSIREEVLQFVIAETVKEACISEEADDQNQETSIEEHEKENIVTLTLHRLVKFLEEEEALLLSACSEIKEQKMRLDLVHSVLGNLDGNHHLNLLFTNEQNSAISTCSKLEKGLEQLDSGKAILSELGSQLGLVAGNLEWFHNEETPLVATKCFRESSILQLKETEDVKVKIYESLLVPVQELSQILKGFECSSCTNLGRHISRVEEMKHRLDLLVELAASLRQKESLYKKAFIRRCESLQMAEAEVDLLGDQVDQLLGLLEKIYITLSPHSLALKQYFGLGRLGPSIGSRNRNYFDFDERIYEDSQDLNMMNHPIINEKDDEVVVRLTETNFSSFIAENGYVMAFLGYPRSRKLPPEYEAAVATLSKDGEVAIAKVDFLTDEDLSLKYKRSGNPRVILFSGGVFEVYDGCGTRDDIVRWVRKNTAGVPIITHKDDAKQLLASDSIKVVGFYDSLESEDSRELFIASKLRSDLKFYQTTDPEIAKMFRIDPEIKHSVLVQLRKEDEDFRQFIGSFTGIEIANFLCCEKPHYTEERSPVVLQHPRIDNFSSFIAENEYVMVIFYEPWSYWSQTLALQYEAAAATLVKNDRVAFAKVDATTEMELATKYRISPMIYGDPMVLLFADGVLKSSDVVRTRDDIVRLIRKSTAGFLSITENDDAEHFLTDFNSEELHVIEQPIINKKDEAVVTLTWKNFSNFIAENEFVMVNFYTTWCRWSQKLTPEYEAAAATLLKGDGVAFAKVNADTERELAWKYGISGYPTLLWFAGGVRSKFYYGQRERDALVTWVRKSITEVPTIIEKDDAEYLLATDFVKVVGFYDTLEGEDSKELFIASKLRPDLKFYQTTNPEVAKIFHINKHAVAVQLRKENEGFMEFDGSIPGKNLADILCSAKDELPCNKGRATPVVSPYPRKEVENEQVIKQQHANYEKEELMVRLAEDSQDATNEKDHEVVVRLTEKNFSSFIAENEYVMVNFYAPWWQWSQELAPVYEAAAATMKGDRIAFAQVDCVPEYNLAMKYHITGHPSIFLFAGGIRKYYDGERTRNDIVRWIRKNIAGISTITEKYDAQHLLVHLGTENEDSKQFVGKPHYTNERTAVPGASQYSRKKSSEFGVLDQIFSSNYGDTDTATIMQNIGVLLVVMLPLIYLYFLLISLTLFWVSNSPSDNSSLLEKLYHGDLGRFVEEIFWRPKPVGNELVAKQPVIYEKDELMVRLAELENQLDAMYEIDNEEGVRLTENSQDSINENDNGVVVRLTEKNFSSFINENKYVMVNFFAPWCWWSQRLAPVYEAAAEAMKDDGVPFAKVDCVPEHELSRKYHITGYPSVFLFAGGVRTFYDGERTRDDIVKWVRESIAGIPIITEKDDAEHLLATDFIKVVGFYDTLKGPDSKELLVASKLRPDLKFYQTTCPEIAKIFDIDPEIKHPVLVQLGSKDEDYKQFVGSFTGLDIANFLSSGKPHYTKERAPMVSQYPRKEVSKIEVMDQIYSPKYDHREDSYIRLPTHSDAVSDPTYFPQVA